MILAEHGVLPYSVVIVAAICVFIAICVATPWGDDQ